MTYHHQPSMQSVLNKQARVSSRADDDWQVKKSRLKFRLIRHINRQIYDQRGLIQRLDKQADKGKNYLRVTRYKNPWSHPLIFNSVEEQYEILSEVVVDLDETMRELYGENIYLEVQKGPLKLDTLLNLTVYDIYLFYKELNDD